MAEVIQDPDLRKFVHTDVSYDFGLSVEQVAQQSTGFGRFSAWLNNDVNRIIEVLNVVKSNGVSPAFFSAYERTEGYNSSWGWLNHTSVNGSPLNDADSVSKWVESQSRSTSHNPAWIDYANYNDFVPQSVKDAGNTHFSNIPIGSIGRVVIAGTAAATWEVYYPQGLLKEYNGVQNYGKPITNMMNYIISWGGNLDGGSVGSKPVFPTTEGLTITSPYGWRTHPITGEPDFHSAIDIGGGGVHRPVYATQSGIIVQNDFESGSGYRVRIEHTADPYFSQYIHLKEPSPLSVGTYVEKGQQIAIMGTSGSSTGIHLDFAIATSLNGFYTENGTIDPLLYLEMTFDDITPPEKPYKDNLIELLLCDALNGWNF